MKKIIILIILFLIFIRVVYYLNNKADTELYDNNYAQPAGEKEEESLWDKTKDFFGDLFGSKEEKFIYK
ncbi:MAG: hypothetical protein HQM16_15080 [Deltaproteobacteria bacterium]|nr:hypothetical protein [Deltaproteobacteria bacterium]